MDPDLADLAVVEEIWLNKFEGDSIEEKDLVERVYVRDGIVRGRAFYNQGVLTHQEGEMTNGGD